jgi:hypothetical protein
VNSCFGSNRSLFRTAVVVSVLMILVTVPVSLLAQRDDDDSLVYPPDSVVYGMTYGDWVVAYWQYILSIPLSTNPAFGDTTGVYCNLDQGSGPVYFLNASGFPDTPITRTCTVPAGKALWVPNLLNECSTVEPPPYHGDNPQELRQCALGGTDAIYLKTVKFIVDGHSIPDVARFRVQGPFYDFVMPAHDNILGLEGVTAGSSVVDAYAIMLKPLSRGHHKIHFEGAFGPPHGDWGSYSVTYNLTVQ